jgi:phosphoglucomutase/phosphomannomutase
MKAVMERLRTNPPQQLGGLTVHEVRDYLEQQTLAPSKRNGNWSKIQNPTSFRDVPRSDLLIFNLDPSGNRAAVRPSGTEPKLKFYLFAYEPPERSTELGSVKQLLATRLAAMETDLLQATK